MEKPIMNEKPFEHRCYNGTIFKCTRCDFRAPIRVTRDRKLSEEQIMQDTAEMISYHALNIWKHLNGFSGYDCLTFFIEG
jgi:hypothetical protein